MLCYKYTQNTVKSLWKLKDVDGCGSVVEHLGTFIKTMDKSFSCIIVVYYFLISQFPSSKVFSIMNQTIRPSIRMGFQGQDKLSRIEINFLRLTFTLSVFSWKPVEEKISRTIKRQRLFSRRRSQWVKESALRFWICTGLKVAGESTFSSYHSRVTQKCLIRFLVVNGNDVSTFA